jgi:hypothetical protein
VPLGELSSDISINLCAGMSGDDRIGLHNSLETFGDRNCFYFLRTQLRGLRVVKDESVVKRPRT